jgi:asparagine synthase (glutamine-hydrolysing)
MCGICGVVALDPELKPAIGEAIVPMTTAIRHRGPDGDGFYRGRGAALGHRRLAIIDRAGGDQPMSNEDGSCWIVFNGEVYNHRELRRELVTRGHRFRTNCDTEAIVHAYEEYGTACPERLEGMFAFAIYDERRHELFVARDRLGKKPFFYAVLDGALHFASEIKAFYASPAWDDAVDTGAIETYLSLGYLLAPDTIYRHVRKLEPGHWLQLKNQRLTIRKYWDLERFDDERRPEDAVVADLDAKLSAAVAERLESEVPLGAFLSGGIDSGLVVSYMADQHLEDLVTVSVGFGDAAHNELDAAGWTASKFETHHHPEVIAPKLDDVLDSVVGGFDEPFADPSAVPTYYVSQIARRYVTVALSGDGGDESFAGYDFRYLPHALEQSVRRFVPRAAGGLLRWVGSRWPRGARVPRALRAGNVLENLGRDPAAAYFWDLCFLKPRDVRQLLPGASAGGVSGSPAFQTITDVYRRCPSDNVVQRAEYADLKVYLPNDVLVKVDRMSMAHGLEVRCPLLDRRIVELAFKTPMSMKMPKLEAKHLLRQVARSRLPDSLLRLPKHGFSAPVGAWIAGPYREMFEADVFGPNAFVASVMDGSRVRAMFGEHLDGRVDRSYALWAVWMLERWNRTTNAVRQSAMRAPLGCC